jgi:hypothetical protein
MAHNGFERDARNDRPEACATVKAAGDVIHQKQSTLYFEDAS